VARLRFGIAAGLCIALASTMAAQDKQSFGMKFTKDDKGVWVPYYQKSTTSVSQEIKVQGQDLTQKQESTFFYKWDPIAQEGEKWKVKQTVEGLSIAIDISGNAVTYDSRVEESTGAASNPGLANFFKGLKGTTFTVTLDKNFRVESVDANDKKAFVAKLSNNNAAMDAMLNKVLTDDALKQMLDPSLGLTPDQPQAVNGEWQKKTPLNLGAIGTYEVTYSFKYVGKDGEFDKVEVKTALAFSPPKETDGVIFKIKSGTLTATNPTPGVIRYNAKAGRIQSANVDLKLSGDLVVSIGNTDTNVHIEQTQKTIIETKDTTFLTPPMMAPTPPTPPMEPKKP
jgi:hypothetical protein